MFTYKICDSARSLRSRSGGSQAAKPQGRSPRSPPLSVAHASDRSQQAAENDQVADDRPARLGPPLPPGGTAPPLAAPTGRWSLGIAWHCSSSNISLPN